MPHDDRARVFLSAILDFFRLLKASPFCDKIIQGPPERQMKIQKENLKYLALAVIGGAALCPFYLKYVPLVTLFQVILLPVLGLLVILTISDLEAGTLLFLFIFPLINNLPYYFGINESVPHAPTALVLFLFYFWAWLVRRASGLTEKTAPSPLLKPMTITAWLVLISAVITFLRFGNFYPFLTDGLYELVTNVNGVTSGGAQMSTVFHSLSYFSEFGFFLVLGTVLLAKDIVRKALTVLGISLFLSLGFGFFQALQNPSLGNTEFWVRLGQINATFKDPNAFGTFLAITGPLLLGASLHFKGWRRIFFGAAFAGTLLILPFIGIRSGLLGFGVAIIAFLGLMARARKGATREMSGRFKRRTLWGMASFLAVLLIVFGALNFKNARVFERLKGNWQSLQAKGGLVSLSPERYFLWKEALHMSRDYPLSGVGTGAYIIQLPNYYTEDKKSYPFGLEAFRRNDSAENYFLQVVAEVGVVGLLAFLWIFWMIKKEIKSGYRKLPGPEENPYLFIGAVAGAISYFINILFHSYIGSPETKFAFWLLIGLIAYWVRDPPRPEGSTSQKFLFNKRQKLAGFIFLVLFGGVHIWNSTHSLSLARQTERYGLKQDFGLYQLEKTTDGREFRWTREYGGLTIKIEKPIIEIPLLASHPDIQQSPVEVRLYIVKDFFKHKRLLDEITLTKSIWNTHKYIVPNEVGQKIILLFKVSRTWNPLKTLGIPDPRNLGIAIGKIEFQDLHVPD